MNTCPVCRKESIYKYAVVRGRDEQTTLLGCNQCLAIINSAAYEEDGESPRLGSVYPSPTDTAEVENQVLKIGSVADYIKRKCPDVDSILEVGCGRGYLARALSRRFESVYATDMNAMLSEGVNKVAQCPSNLFFIGTFKDLPRRVDGVVLWHVLEHIRSPVDFFNELSHVCNYKWNFIAQVPLLRPEYVVRDHAIFYNEVTVNILADVIGAVVKSVTFDANRWFITFHLESN